MLSTHIQARVFGSQNNLQFSTHLHNSDKSFHKKCFLWSLNSKWHQQPAWIERGQMCCVVLWLGNEFSGRLDPFKLAVSKMEEPRLVSVRWSSLSKEVIQICESFKHETRFHITWISFDVAFVRCNFMNECLKRNWAVWVCYDDRMSFFQILLFNVMEGCIRNVINVIYKRRVSFMNRSTGWILGKSWRDWTVVANWWLAYQGIRQTIVNFTMTIEFMLRLWVFKSFPNIPRLDLAPTELLLAGEVSSSVQVHRSGFT